MYLKRDSFAQKDYLKQQRKVLKSSSNLKDHKKRRISYQLLASTGRHAKNQEMAL